MDLLNKKSTKKATKKTKKKIQQLTLVHKIPAHCYYTDN